jgi:hypothetical protein
LAANRARAEALERENPEQFRYSGAAGWENGSISSYLEAALAGSVAQSAWCSTGQPSWRDLALFLYLGNVYE